MTLAAFFLNLVTMAGLKPGIWSDQALLYSIRQQLSQAEVLTDLLFAGLMALAAAKAFSASAVAITDIRPGNLPVALELGATHALDQSKATSAADTVASLKRVFPEGPDIVIDCVGMSTTLTVSGKQPSQQRIHTLGAQGTLLIYLCSSHTGSLVQPPAHPPTHAHSPLNQPNLTFVQSLQSLSPTGKACS